MRPRVATQLLNEAIALQKTKHHLQRPTWRKSSPRPLPPLEKQLFGTQGVSMHDVHSWRPLTPMSQVFSSTFKMASMGVFLVISLLLGFALVNGEHLQNTLNLPPRVLLPYVASGSVHTNFSFKVLHGCFVWWVSFTQINLRVPANLTDFDLIRNKSFCFTRCWCVVSEDFE